jgi:multidrug resistance protein MdtO
MATHDQALPAPVLSGSLDSGASWLWQFLKTELVPYPGRLWVVSRITIAATIIMILVMTFRIPYGFLGCIYTLFLSRESPNATLLSGAKTILVYGIATIYTVLGIMLLVDDPLTHFLWIGFSLFLAFYIIHIMPDYGTSIGFGFTLAGAIPLWDQTQLTVNQRTENTLWLGFVVLVGAAVTVAVEYVFRRVRPITDVNQLIETRLRVVEDVLRQVGAGLPVDEGLSNEIAQTAARGTSTIRRRLLRSDYAPRLIAQMNTAVALLGRLVDLTVSLGIVYSTQSISVPPGDRERCLRLADQLAELRQNVHKQEMPRPIEVPEHEAAGLPLLAEIERTLTLIPQAFSGSENLSDRFVPPPLYDETNPRVFVPDAFSNPEHLKFAIRGTAATMTAYITYQAINYPALSTAVATCIITALSTIGSSRQKQFLRLAGATLGGFVFGMGAQVFVLPHLDSIVGFTVLFAVVTAISAWLATATPRLSYLGVQAALAFYLINVQEFTIQSSLAIARDRVVGVLLGLLAMWAVFDRLWVRNALQEMRDGFATNLRRLAELIELARKTPSEEVAKRATQLRDQINAGFNTVRSQSDAVLFEFGASRQRKLEIRNDIQRWQPALGALLQVQMTGLQYLYQKRYPKLGPAIEQALSDFEESMAVTARTMSDEVSEKLAQPAPDVRASAARLRDEIKKEYATAGQPIPPSLVDLITLAQNLAFIIAPLSADIHATFSAAA